MRRPNVSKRSTHANAARMPSGSKVRLGSSNRHPMHNGKRMTNGGAARSHSGTWGWYPLRSATFGNGRQRDGDYQQRSATIGNYRRQLSAATSNGRQRPATRRRGQGNKLVVIAAQHRPFRNMRTRTVQHQNSAVRISKQRRTTS
jgi:hypothetical protein